MLAVVLAILTKLVATLKLGLRSILKRITSLIFLNICTPLQHALTHIILFFLNNALEETENDKCLLGKEDLRLEK